MRRNGFTLVEMLVSLAVLSLVATMLLGGLQGVGAFVQRSDVRQAGFEEVASAHRLLRGRIEQLRPVVRQDSSIPQVDAQGDGGSFTFIAPPLDRAAPDALWRYRIIATAAGDLILYWANSLDDRYDFEAGMAGWQPITLLKSVGAVAIDYMGEDLGGRSGRRWHASWAGRPQPPDLVRVRVTFRAGDRRSWPDLIVRPRATVNTACKIDALTGRCEQAL